MGFDMTDLVTAMRKVDAYHDPSEANDLLTAAANEIDRLRTEIAALKARDMREYLTGKKQP